MFSSAFIKALSRLYYAFTTTRQYTLLPLHIQRNDFDASSNNQAQFHYDKGLSTDTL